MAEPLFNSSLREGKDISQCALCKKHFDSESVRPVDLLKGFPAVKLCAGCRRRCQTESLKKRLEIMKALYPDRKEEIAAVMLPADYRAETPSEDFEKQSDPLLVAITVCGLLVIFAILLAFFGISR